MKAYLAEVLVIGLEDITPDDVEFHLTNNDINSHIISMRTADIGKWGDNHPLNNTRTMLAGIRSYFPGSSIERPLLSPNG